MPLFSVVIPTYNRRERLLRALASVLAQRFADYEIIVVDDGSTDGTSDAVSALSEEIQVLKQANRGPAAARSAGVRAASGKYIAFLDSDDAWFPWTLEVMAKTIEQHDNPSWLYGGGVTTHGKQFAVETPIVAKRYSEYTAAAEANGLMPLPTGVAILRSLFLDVGGFRESMLVAEDVDLWFRIGAAAGFVLIERPMMYVRDAADDSQGENILKSYAGMKDLSNRELLGEYGGTRHQVSIRRAIIRRQLIYYSDRYLERGKRRQAIRFYLEVWRHHLHSAIGEHNFTICRDSYLASFLVKLLSPNLYSWLKRKYGDPSRKDHSSPAKSPLSVCDRDWISPG